MLNESNNPHRYEVHTWIIYGLFHGDEIRYVGLTRSPKTRFSDHKSKYRDLVPRIIFRVKCDRRYAEVIERRTLWSAVLKGHRPLNGEAFGVWGFGPNGYPARPIPLSIAPSVILRTGAVHGKTEHDR